MITLALAAIDPAKARNEDILPSGISDTQTIPAGTGIVTAANIGWRPLHHPTDGPTILRDISEFSKKIV